MPQVVTTKQLIYSHHTKFLSDAVLYYELIEESRTFGQMSYSIYVRLTYENSSFRECLVKDVTSEYTAAIRLYQLVVCGLVTPYTLTEVLSDLVAEL